MTGPQSPALREETQRETVGGMLGALDRFIDRRGANFGRSMLGLVVLLPVVLIIAYLTAPKETLAMLVEWQRADVAEAVAAEREAQRLSQIDDFICAETEQLRVRTGGARSAARTFAFSRESNSEPIGVEDVCESMDQAARASGIGATPLSLSAIEDTVDYLRANPGQCLSRNTDEVDKVQLKLFLSSTDLKSFVVCGVWVRDTQLEGLLALTHRAPLERTPDFTREVRDVSLKFSGYWDHSSKVQAARNRIKARAEREGDQRAVQ